MSTVAASAAAASTEEAAAPAVRSGASRMRRGLSVVGPPLVVLLIVLGLWELASEVLISPGKRFLLPAPQHVFHGSIVDGYFRSQIASGLWLTAKAALIGLAIAIVVGMAIAILMSQAKWIERSLYPYAVILQTIPILAIVPLIGFSLGFNFNSRVFVCVLIALFPVITNTLFGLLSVDRGMHDLFTLHHVGRVRRLVKLQLPAAMPSIFTGFRIAAGASVIGAVVGDFFFKQGTPGIGVLIDLYSSQLQSDQLYGAVIAASLLGVVFFVLVGFAERRVIGRWHEATRPGG
jgi:NitT/TauT family transport system permease protein